MPKIPFQELAVKVGRHPTTVFRWLRGTLKVQPEDAKKLEVITGIGRLSWLYPDEFHNPYIPRAAFPLHVHPGKTQNGESTAL